MAYARITVNKSPRYGALLLGIGLLFHSSIAYSVLTDNLSIGNAKAVGLAHAVTADPPGIDSIHFNPAGLLRLKGRQRHLKAILADFSIRLEFGENSESRQQFIDEFQALGLLPDEKFIDPVENTTSQTEGASIMLPFAGKSDAPIAFGASAGFSYRPNGRDYAFATNVYTPLAVGLYRADDDPGRFMVERYGFTLLTYFSPAVAFKLTEDISIGAVVTFNYAGVGLDLAFRHPNSLFGDLAEIQAGCNNQLGVGDQSGRIDIADLVDLCSGQLGLYDQLGYLSFEVEKPLTFGFNFGVLWEPKPWFTAGFVYHAPIKMSMKGEYTWSSSDEWVKFFGPIARDEAFIAAADFAATLGFVLPTGEAFSEGPLSAEMEMPEHYALGVSLQLMPSLKLNVDYKFTGWSSWESIPLQFAKNIDFLVLAEYLQPEVANRNSLSFPLGLEDSWNWAAGVEYQYSDRLVLRAGIEDRPTSIPETAKTPFLPISSGTFYGAGFSYKTQSNATIEAGLAIFSSSDSYPGGTSRFGNSENPNLVIYNPYAGRDIESATSFTIFTVGYSSEY